MKKDFSPQILEVRRRVLDLKNKFDIFELKRGGRLAKKLGVHNSVITRLIDHISFPTIENIITICKNAEVSADYLLFGREQMRLEEFTSENYIARPLAPIEADLLHRVNLLVEEILTKEKKKLSPEQKSRLITRIYNDCAEDRSQPDDIMVKRYLWILN